jgi:hypothetical protein
MACSEYEKPMCLERNSWKSGTKKGKFVIFV